MHAAAGGFYGYGAPGHLAVYPGIETWRLRGDVRIESRSCFCVAQERNKKMRRHDGDEHHGAMWAPSM